MSDLYARIKRLCDEKGVRGATMSRQTGLSPNFLTELKSGRKKSVNAGTAEKLARYFGVSVDYLLGVQDDRAEPGNSARDDPAELVNGDPELTEYLQQLSERSEMRMLFHVTKHATKEQIEAIVRMVESLQTPEE